MFVYVCVCVRVCVSPYVCMFMYVCVCTCQKDIVTAGVGRAQSLC